MSQEKIQSPKKVKNPTQTDVDDVEDVTEAVAAANLKMVSSSEDTFSNPQQQLANEKPKAALTSIDQKLKNLNGRETMARRVPHLDVSQKYPYVGNSTVKRIITVGEPATSIPDHLKSVSDEKYQKLMDFLELDE